jgi:dihydroflavonol-4-reductase
MIAAVTGAAGHLGNNLVRLLAGQGWRIRCLVLATDDLAPLAATAPAAGAPPGPAPAPAIEIIHADVRDQPGLEQAFRGVDVVFHLASVISIAGGKLKLMEDVNVRGARAVARACLSAGVGRLVHASSIHALREPPHGQVFDEAQAFEPEAIRMSYGRTKALGTLEVLAAARDGLDAVIACPTGIIGPHDYRPSEMGQMIIDYARGRLRAIVRGAYDFVDVRDVAAGLVAMAEHAAAGESYILSGEHVTVAQLVERLAWLMAEVDPPGRPQRRCIELPAWAADVAAGLSPAYCRLTGARPRLTRDSLETLRANSRISHAKATLRWGYDPRPLSLSLCDAVAWFRATGKI